MYENEMKYKYFGNSLLLKAFGDSPKLRIIDIFLTNPLFDFSKNELARELGMSKQTLYRCFSDLEEIDLIRVSRKIGRANLYKLNLKNPMVKMLNEYTSLLSLKIAEKEKVTVQRPASSIRSSSHSKIKQDRLQAISR